MVSFSNFRDWCIDQFYYIMVGDLIRRRPLENSSRATTLNHRILIVFHRYKVQLMWWVCVCECVSDVGVDTLNHLWKGIYDLNHHPVISKQTVSQSSTNSIRFQLTNLFYDFINTIQIRWTFRKTKDGN